MFICFGFRFSCVLLEVFKYCCNVLVGICIVLIFCKFMWIVLFIGVFVGVRMFVIVKGVLLWFLKLIVLILWEIIILLFIW